jgi:hypothetical protein
VDQFAACSSACVGGVLPARRASRASRRCSFLEGGRT